jgi:hypothetical protein
VIDNLFPNSPPAVCLLLIKRVSSLPVTDSEGIDSWPR